MRTPMALTVLLLLASAGPVAAAQDGLHPAVFEMGPIRIETECAGASPMDSVRPALSAAIRVVVRADGDWRPAARKLEALAHQPRFADCQSQQAIAAVALRAVLLNAPPEADGAVAKHLFRLGANEGVAFVAMVEALDRVRGDLPAETVRAYEQVIAARYRERFDPDCVRCTAAEADTRRRLETAAADEPSVLERLPAERRERARREIARHVAASARIAEWAD